MTETRVILTIGTKELRDAWKNRWFLLYTIAFTSLALALASLALAGAGNLGLAGFGRTGASLVNLILLIVPLMGLSLGALSISGEREHGALLYILAHPISKLEILLGKYLGISVAIFSALLIGFGLSGLFIAIQGNQTQIGSYLVMVGLAYLLALVTLSMGFLISSLTQKASMAMGFALFLWLGLVFFGDLGLMGTALTLKIGLIPLFFITLVNPLQVFKTAAILTLNSNLEVLGPAAIYATRLLGNWLLPLLVTILTIWVLAPAVIAYLCFQKRGVV